jgi:phage terminase large subunit-like protein
MPSRESFAYRRAAQLKAQKATEPSGDNLVETIYTKAADDFHTFCTLLDKPPAPHMLQWHRELITGQSNRYLLDIAGENTDILSPRGAAKSTVLNLFTAWCIGRHTAAKRPLQIIYVSYNIATAIPKSRIIKQIVDSPEFKKIFPSCRLKPGMQSDIGWSIDFEYAGIPRMGEEEFTLRAAGLRGSITSKRAHLCLTSATLVQTQKGLTPIANVYRDPEKFLVPTYNRRLQRIEWSRIRTVTRRRTRGIVELGTGHNAHIQSSPEHPFYTENRGIVSAEDLRVGDRLVSFSAHKSHGEAVLHRGVSDVRYSFPGGQRLEGSSARQSRQQVFCLFEEVCDFQAPHTSKKCLLRLSKRVSPWKQSGFSEVLLNHVRRGSESALRATSVLGLLQNFQTSELQDSNVLPSLCRKASLGFNDGETQSKVEGCVCAAQTPDSMGSNKGSRQLQVFSLLYRGEEVVCKRLPEGERIFSNQFSSSSYQCKSFGEYSRKFDNSLSPLPYIVPSDVSEGSNNSVTIRSVYSAREREEFVYDLETVSNNHNFLISPNSVDLVLVANCIVDDPIKSSTDIRNPAIREEQNNNWSSVIAPIIFEGGRSICLGTRFHPLDIHKTMFIPEKGWKQVVQEALTYDNHGNAVSYWPEQWSVEYLQQQKELDPVAFAFQYQQQPVLTSDLIVSPELLVKGEVVTEFDSLAVGIDLSASRNETSDYTAFVLGGRLKDMYYIIDAHQCRSIGNLEKIDLLCDMLLEWGILVKQDNIYAPTYSTVTLVVESVAYQASLAADIKRVLINERELTNLNIHEVKGFRGDKLSRFRGTLGILEHKKVVFNKYRKFDALFEQLINVGATSHDDLLDAYTHLITFLQRRGSFSIEY